MESNRKRRGFIKGKLVMSFYRVPKSSSPMQFSSKVKPNPPASTASVGFHVDEKFAIPPPMKQKSSVITKTDGGGDLGGHVDGISGVDAGVTTEECVDKRAATYISYVQERFRLERSDTDWRKYQEIQARTLH